MDVFRKLPHNAQPVLFTLERSDLDRAMAAKLST